MPEETEGARIAQARRELGCLLKTDVGQADLARLLETDLSSVWNWENDNKRPNDVSRAKLSAILGVTEAYLRYGTEPKARPEWTPPCLAAPPMPDPKKDRQFAEAEVEQARRDEAVARTRRAKGKRRRGKP